MLETAGAEPTVEPAGTPEDWSAPTGTHEARDVPNTDVGPSVNTPHFTPLLSVEMEHM